MLMMETDSGSDLFFMICCISLHLFPSKVSDAKFDGVPVKIFRPRTAQTDSPAIIFIHGGGWSLLSAGEVFTILHLSSTV